MTNRSVALLPRATFALGCLAAVLGIACNESTSTTTPAAATDSGTLANRARDAGAIIRPDSASPDATAIANTGGSDAGARVNAAPAAETDDDRDETTPPADVAPPVHIAFERLAPEEIRRGGLCAAFRRVHATAIRARLIAVEPTAARLLPPGIGLCVAAGHSAWAVALESARFSHSTAPGSPPLTMVGRYRVVHIAADGHVHGATPALLPCTDSTVTGRGNVCVATGRRTTRIDLRPLADYDDDGERETLVRVTETITDGQTSPERARVYGLHRSSVVTFGATTRYTVRDASDLDGDRRPDLRIALFTAPGPLNATDHPTGTIDGPRYVAHATGEGGFSISDEIATREFARVCRSAPARIVALDRARAVDLAATGRNVVCARARGMSADAIEAGLRETCRSFADNVRRVRGEPVVAPVVCPHWLLTWARRPPPIALPSR